jgi:FlaA1/EpsC-like NDP-sugar epimerase
MERLFSSIEPYEKTKFICVRYGNVTWSTGSVLPIWKQMFNKNKTILTTGPNMRRFFFSVDEAVNLIDQALKLKDKLLDFIKNNENTILSDPDEKIKYRYNKLIKYQNRKYANKFLSLIEYVKNQENKIKTFI